MAATSKTFTFRLPETFANELEGKAKEENKSPGTWVRELVLEKLNGEPKSAAAGDQMLAVQRMMAMGLESLENRTSIILDILYELQNATHQPTCPVAHATKPETADVTKLTTIAAQFGKAVRDDVRTVAAKLDQLAATIGKRLGDEQVKVPNGPAAISRQLNLLRWDLLNALIILLADAGKMEFDDARTYAMDMLEFE